MGSNILIQKLVFVAQIASQAVLYVLLGLSVLSIGVIIERWWYFRRRRDNVDALSDKLRRAFGRGDLEAARQALSDSPSVEAEIVREALDWYDDGPEAVEQILAKATRVRRKKFESGLLFLGTLGNNAPFIGLFGTVLGIIRAFHDLAGNSLQGTQAVMSGIAEALVATGVGLLVALPAVAAIIWLSAPIVRTFFEGGAFDASATRVVTSVQQFALLQVPFAILFVVAGRLAVAISATAVMIQASLLTVAATAVGDLILSRTMGIAGIPLAGALAHAIAFASLVYFLYRREPRLFRVS